MNKEWNRPARLPRRSPARPPEEEEQETWLSRGMAVLIAVPFFELSLYLGLSVLMLSPRWAAYAWMSLPGAFHMLYVALAVLVAAWHGMRGLTQLMGHLFLTHPPPVRNEITTVALWSALAGSALVAHLLGG